MPLPSHTYWTTDLLAALPEDGQRHELVHGELLVSPAPSLRHQRLARLLSSALDAWLSGHPVGEVLFAPLALTIAEDTEVQPDLLVIPLLTPRPERWDDVRRLLLVIEILSPSTARHDRFPKRRLYQELGVPLYWIVDPEARAVELWTPADRFPRLERGSLRWQPEGCDTAFALDLPALFAAG